ncbi:MAG: bifunctional phosphoglucose/phosphomannose isomerase [Thermoplasmata archaeon]|nr:bifunctional phosphoglucose/phosphomannose isomerase [Candidatus Sysuiplasma acidicola]
MGAGMLDIAETYDRIDREDMFRSIVSLPFQLEKGWELASNLAQDKVGHKTSSFLISGMGGSAIGGDLFKDIIDRYTTFSVNVNRNYVLPRLIGDATLHIAVSYSGNTEESVSSLRDAVRRNIPSIAISSGGEMESISREHGLSFIRMPAGLQPRAAVGYMLGTIIGIATRLSIYDFSKTVMDGIQAARSTIASLSRDVPAEKNEAKMMAEWIGDGTPLIMTTPGLYSLGERMKTQFNENSKRFAWLSVLPELNHNEWIPMMESDISHYRIILLEDCTEHPLMVRRVEVVKKLLSARAEIRTVRLREGNPLSSFIQIMALGDITSYYLAILHNTDPTPVAPIETLKKEISSFTTVG